MICGKVLAEGWPRHKLCDPEQAPPHKGDPYSCETKIIRACCQVVVRIKGDPAEGRVCERKPPLGVWEGRGMLSFCANVWDSQRGRDERE